MSDHEKRKKKEKERTVTDEKILSSFDDYEPSVTLSVFLYWILPILLITCTSRFLVDPEAKSGLWIGDNAVKNSGKPGTMTQPPSSVPTKPTIAPKPQKPKRKPTPVPTLVLEKPTAYIEAVQAIARRRLNWEETDSSTMENYGSDDTEETRKEAQSEPEQPSRGPSTDPVRKQIFEKIDSLRDAHKVRCCSPKSKGFFVSFSKSCLRFLF